MKYAEYVSLVADYLLENFKDRGIELYTEVPVGKSIIGKNRRIDLFVHREESSQAFAIECKYQDGPGTTDEKIPYALEDMRSMPMGGCLVYAGHGFSQGVLHMLQSSEIAAYCLPERPALKGTKDTRELDHLLALHFRWWDVILENKKPYGS